MLVKELMTSRVISVGSRKSIEFALKVMCENSIRRLPVIDDGRLTGMIVQHDIEKAMSRPGVIPETPVDWVMNKPVLSISANADIVEAVRLLKDRKISGLPVLEGGKVIGIISESDILEVFIDLMEKEREK